jgi:dihydrofolate reductase
MRKIVLQLAVSLDGFIEDASGAYDWCFTDDDYGMSDFLKRIDTLLMGRKTYEVLLSMGENALPGFPKFRQYVVSTSLSATQDESILINDNVEERIAQLKKEPGKDIWLFGGASLTTFLMNKKLVDEIILAVHPILLGSGKSLFQGIKQRMPLQFQHSKAYPSGLVMLYYTVIKG